MISDDLINLRLLENEFGPAFKIVIPIIERLANLHGINQLYRQASHCHSPFEFVSSLLDSMQVKRRVINANFLPHEGPCIVVANHPFGALDGLMLIEILGQCRKDVKLMVNYLLNAIPQLQTVNIVVDPFLRGAFRQKNTKGIKEALRYLQNGLVAIFPAGEVSHYSLKNKKIKDMTWQSAIGKFIHLAKVPIVPLYFSGKNSLTFQLLGMIHPLLRTLRLPRELLNKRGATVRVIVGKPIPYQNIKNLSHVKLMQHLYQCTYALHDKE